MIPGKERRTEEGRERWRGEPHMRTGGSSKVHVYVKYLAKGAERGMEEGLQANPVRLIPMADHGV